jgi:hypothetical protein
LEISIHIAQDVVSHTACIDIFCGDGKKKGSSGDTMRVSVKASKSRVHVLQPATRETKIIHSSGKSGNYCEVGNTGSMVVARAGGAGVYSNAAESIYVPQHW